MHGYIGETHTCSRIFIYLELVAFRIHVSACVLADGYKMLEPYVFAPPMGGREPEDKLALWVYWSWECFQHFALLHSQGFC